MRAELSGRYRLVPQAVTTSSWSIALELAGATFVVPVDGLEVNVAFPDWPGSLIPSSGYHGQTGSEGNVEPDAVSPSFVIARVEFFIPSGISCVEESPELRRLIQGVYDSVVKALIRLRSWVRIGQPWLGLTGPAPEPIEPVAVRVLPDMTDLPGRPYVGQGGVSVVGGPAFSRADLDEMMATAGDPPTSQEFLAEARLAIRWAPVKDPQRAVLLAAMACEQHAKEVLLRVSGDTTAALLSAVIRTVRALDLFSTIPEAMINRSLKHEDPALLAQIRTMFELRNGLAHRGNRATIEQARNVVTTGDAAFAWLQTLGSPAP